MNRAFDHDIFGGGCVTVTWHEAAPAIGVEAQMYKEYTSSFQGL
jgi:hypothetical protein